MTKSLLTSRRSLLFAAPAVIAYSALMPVKTIASPCPDYIYMPWDFFSDGAIAEEMLDDACAIHWRTMVRTHSVLGESAFLNSSSEVANVGTEKYARWLREDTRPRNLPPHIGFGGGKVPVPGGDPTFYRRWQLNARAAYGPNHNELPG